MISKKLQTIFTELSETLAPPQVHTVDCRPATTSTSTAFFTAGGLSSLEFYRDFVSTSTPVLFKGGARHLPAFRKWSKKYLIEKTKGKQLKVALTPNGRADSLVDIDLVEDGSDSTSASTKVRVFLSPAETQMTSEEFFTLMSDAKKKYKARFIKALMKVKAKQQQKQQQTQSEGEKNQEQQSEEDEEDLVIPYQQAQNNCLLSDDTYIDLIPDLFDRPYDLQAEQTKQRRERLSKFKSEEDKQREKEEDELLKDYNGPQGIITELLKKQQQEQEPSSASSSSKDTKKFTQQNLVDQCSIAGFASEIFGALPDASNIWIGSELSVTSLHQDWYENFYVVIRGSKLFTLVPPTDCFAVPKIRVPEGKYEFDEATKKFKIVLVDNDENHKSDENHDDDNGGEEKEQEEKTEGFMWVDFDEAKTEENGGHVFNVEVEEGDVLYLPSQWYHQVAQKETHPNRRKAAATAAGATEEEAAALAAMAVDENDFICAVNFWFDMKFGHGFFLQRMMKQLLGHPDAF